MKSPPPPLDIVVLAEPGEPGPLSPALFRPIVHYVLDAAAALPHRSLSLAAGGMEAALRERCGDYPELVYVRSVAASLTGRTGSVLVLPANAPLLRSATLAGMAEFHAARAAACTLAVSGVAVFESQALLAALRTGTAQGPGLEGAIEAIAKGGLRIESYPPQDPSEFAAVKDLEALSKAEAVLRERTNRGLMLRGVRIEDPRSTLIDPRSKVAAGVVVEAQCRIVDSEIEEGTVLKQGSRVEGSRLGRGCLIGPYANIRPGSRLEDRVRAGNFVEIKNSRLGEGSKAAHLSYIGDAEIGRNVMMGCGFITCNSDGGPVKRRTVIEDGVFIGSDSQAVAPVRIGAGSFIATGSTVTEDVPPDSFVISRGRQVTKAGYARRYRPTPGSERTSRTR